jgi:DNA-binding winged helix-turn-helix (wHTH) protein
MEVTGKRRIRFGDFELDPTDRLLSRCGTPVALQAKPLALLIHLITERHRVVLREELMSYVWPGVVVSDAALLSALRDLLRALGDEAHHAVHRDAPRRGAIASRIPSRRRSRAMRGPTPSSDAARSSRRWASSSTPRARAAGRSPS